MGKKITDNVTWVGKVDWDLVHYEKNVLIDTVWRPYDREFVKRLKEVIDLKDIDYIVMNHNEIDHSGALPELLREIPGTPIYCTKKGEAILRGHYHQDWNYVNVKTGDTLNIGKHTLTFIEAPMLHWPDTMFTYMSGDDILFSNDAFGQHYATESLFDTAANVNDVMYEAEKYYTNILNLYSPMVARKVKEVLGMNLPIKMIAPSHGVIWTKYIQQIIENYQKWSTPYQENQITIIYDTMWQSTRLMGEAIAEGIRRADPSVEVKLYNVAKEDKNDVLTQMFRSKAVLVGSPTINYGYSFAIAGILEMARGLKFKGKKAAAFGSYGWSGDAPKLITKHLQEAGFDVVNDGIKCLWVPDNKAIDECRDYGEQFCKKVEA